MPALPATSTVGPCPCGSGLAYSACCAPLHAGQAAADAASLMRSRYSAYALGLTAYLLASWHPRTRPATLDLTTPPQPKWLGLELRHFTPIDQHHAQVEFVARGKHNGRAFRLHETSRFERIGEHWLYLDGDIHEGA